MDYLQHIHMLCRLGTNVPLTRILVSGADDEVRRVVGSDIVASAWRSGKTLFLVDNTQNYNNMPPELGPYPVSDIRNGGICLCPNLLSVDSLDGTSRLRSLLTRLSFDEKASMKVVTYLEFVRETQRRLGEPTSLTPEILEQYGSVMLVERKLHRLKEIGKLSELNYQYLMGRYSEISSAAADFETFLTLFKPFLKGKEPASQTAVHLPYGTYSADRTMQRLMSLFLTEYLRVHPSDTAVLILDDGIGADRSFLTDILMNIPSKVELHWLSRDAFTMERNDTEVLLNTFPVRIYSRHDSMNSCGLIETLCGQIDVVKYTTTVTVDKRSKASSAWDKLLGNDRTVAKTALAPAKESLYTKETIHSLPPGTGILDAAGENVLLSFQTQPTNTGGNYAARKSPAQSALDGLKSAFRTRTGPGTRSKVGF